MKLHIRELSRGAVASTAAVILLACAGLTHAQTRRDAERRADMEARTRALRTLSETLKKREKPPPDTRPSYQQVAEDFTQLQLRNHNLSAAAEPEAALDYRQIAEEAAEVRRRATRLKTNLALPAAKDDGQQQKDEGARAPEGLKADIAALDALVKSFVWNPVFQNPNVLDAENSAKAARELEEILRLSEQIRRAAEAHGKE